MPYCRVQACLNRDAHYRNGQARSLRKAYTPHLASPLRGEESRADFQQALAVMNLIRQYLPQYELTPSDLKMFPKDVVELLEFRGDDHYIQRNAWDTIFYFCEIKVMSQDFGHVPEFQDFGG